MREGRSRSGSWKLNRRRGLTEKWTKLVAGKEEGVKIGEREMKGAGH